MKSTVITSGLIRRNFLEDFPQHLMMEVGTDYKLIITSSDLSLIFELNPLRDLSNLLKITPTCLVKIPFKVYNDSNVVINWGDRRYNRYDVKA